MHDHIRRDVAGLILHMLQAGVSQAKHTIVFDLKFYFLPHLSNYVLQVSLSCGED